eukprot:CAMPEP_0201871714 /NCGR_PEP_ID=MMETSP0902-20130614/4573_1 /ASSEMBLY_ACC=CAM_ASM_000551 /TAXON_ID=420261 /ORGANISM="Thalassiosira antarctica, Strain CCMP982" /LENGTH=88 /DNA_ID=CAMNT_0048397777 /DNA_START=232 /DNA_END=498 /DNA_ORIENTATION=-
MTHHLSTDTGRSSGGLAVDDACSIFSILQPHLHRTLDPILLRSACDFLRGLGAQILDLLRNMLALGDMIHHEANNSTIEIVNALRSER